MLAWQAGNNAPQARTTSKGDISKEGKEEHKKDPF